MPYASLTHATAIWPHHQISSRNLYNHNGTFYRTYELLFRHAVEQGIDQVSGLLGRLDIGGGGLLGGIQHGLITVGAQVHQACLQLGQLLRVDVLSPVVDDDEQSFQGHGHDIEIVAIALFDDLDYAGDQG